MLVCFMKNNLRMPAVYFFFLTITKNLEKYLTVDGNIVISGTFRADSSSTIFQVTIY